MTDDRQTVSAEEYEQVKALLGVDAETFIRTKLGRYVLDRAKMEEEQLIEALIVVDPGDRDKVQELQNQISLQRILPRYLQDAIQSGRAGAENLNQMEAAAADT